MIKGFLILISLFQLSLNAQFSDSEKDLRESIALKGASLGVCIIDLTNDSIVLGSNEHQFFYPASVQKMVSTAAALELLGPEYKYSTAVYYTGLIEENVLKGDLIIEASGDPTINSSYLDNDFQTALIKALKAKGVTRIEGEVKFSDSNPNHNTPQSWLFEDIGNYYGVSPQLFNYMDNAYRLTFNQAQNGISPSVLSVSPKIPYTFDLNLICSSEVTGDHAYILGAPFSIEREVVGSITAGVGTFTIKGANAHPQYSFLKALNSEIPFLSVMGMNRDDKKLLTTIQSRNISEIVKLTNHESINLYAEGVLNTLGLNLNNKYSTQAGLDAIQVYLNANRVDSKELIMKDGSGLSRLNAMTPFFAANWVSMHYNNEIFRNTLPVSGETGTLRYLNHAGIKGKVHAKSGSAEGVVNYAGYFTDGKGTSYAFAIFVNHAYQSRYSIRREIGAFLANCI